MENDEVIIDLRLLIWEVLRKWHIIALVCIICAVLFGTFSVYRNNVANKEVPIEDLYEELEPAEITKVHKFLYRTGLMKKQSMQKIQFICQ